MHVKIMVDSTADLSPEIVSEFAAVPLTVHFGAEEYADGVTISRREFYEKLIESDVMPTTSQATPHAFSEAYEKVFAEGFDEIVVLTIASNLSGTYQSACIAADDFDGRVHVVDTRTVAIGSGVLAEYALQLSKEGKSGGEIAEIMEEQKGEVRIVALLDTLEYLKRGGRISKTAALAGSLLSIKPVIAVEDGEIKVLGKARGSKQANNLLVTQIRKAGSVDFAKPVLLGYTGLNDELLWKYANDSRALWEGRIDHLNATCVGSVVGTHAGPGAVAVAFFRRNAE